MRQAKRLAVLALLAAAAGASAKDGAALKDADELAKKKEWVKAAERFGDAVASAQRAGDLQAESDAADALDSFFDGLPEDPAPDAKPPRAPTRSAVLAATMRKLDASRCGAYVSAPVLARNVLQLATECGDFAAVADAAKVAVAAMAKPTSGAAAPVVAKYAEGLTAVAEGRFADAAVTLQSVAADAGKAKWFELEMHASTELAAAWLHQNAPDKAAAAIAATAAQIDDTCGTELPGEWQTMTKLRCVGAPAALAKPIDDLVARANKSTKGGGSASAGGSSGGQVSPIGKLLPTWPNAKPFVSAARKPKGFEISWATKPKDKPLVAFPGKMSQASEGGVKLGFFGRSVALTSVELADEAGVAISAGSPSPVRAFYLLAEGETWGVSKDGVVTISR
jgi:hypothetical protein